MKNSKSKYYQIPNKSKIPNPKQGVWDFDIGIYLVVLVLFEFWI